MIEVKKGYIDISGHATIVRPSSAAKWLWLKRQDVGRDGFSLIVCENSGDIFLEDYFYDLDNPTDIELSLLQLEHGITYLKDE